MTLSAIAIFQDHSIVVDLHGPVEKALKNYTQADSVRVFPLSVVVHGEKTDVEMWTNSTPAECMENINIVALAILQHQVMRNCCITPPCSYAEIEEFFRDHEEQLENSFHVAGPAVLTGPGATNISDIHSYCLLEALLS